MKRIAFSALFILSFSTGSLLSSDGFAEDSPSGNRWNKMPAWARNDSLPNADEDGLGDPTEKRTPSARSRRPAATLQTSQSRTTPFVPGSNNLSLDVGQVFLMGDMGDRYTDSIGSRLNYTYGVSDMFSFNSSFGYSSHSDGNFSMSSLLAGLRSNLAWYDKVIPYAVFGMGFYRPSYKESDYSTVLFGMHLGAGVNLELTPSLFFGASLTLNNAFGSDRNTSSEPLPIGGTFSSFFLSAGATF